MSLDFWGAPVRLPVPAARPAQSPAAPPHTWGHVPPAVRPTSWATIVSSPEPPAPERRAHRPRTRRTGLVALRTLVACVTAAACAVDAASALDTVPAMLGLLAQ